MLLTNNILWLLGGQIMGFGGQSISRELRACAQLSLPLSLLSRRLNKPENAPEPNSNHHSPGIIERCQRHRFRSSTAVIGLHSVFMAAMGRLGCCIPATRGLWEPGSNPGNAKPNCGPSTRFSGERWWTPRKEQEVLRYKAGKSLQKRSFHTFTQFHSELFVHSWGYS